MCKRVNDGPKYHKGKISLSKVKTLVKGGPKRNIGNKKDLN